MGHFLFMTVVGRITGILMLFAIGGLVLLLFGDSDPQTPKQKAADQIDQSTDALDGAADAAASGLQILDAQNQLMVDGDLDRYRIQRLERSEDGDLNVFTGLPSGKASEQKVAKLCEKLIGGNPPLVDVSDFVLVFGQGIQHIRADECDVQYWQGGTAPAN